MTIQWHWLGREHPLVQELDAISQQENVNACNRARIERGQECLGRYQHEDRDSLRIQRNELCARREAIEAQIQALKLSSTEQDRFGQRRQNEARQQIATKRQLVRQLQLDIADLQHELSMREENQLATERLKHQLNRTGKRLAQDGRRDDEQRTA